MQAQPHPLEPFFQQIVRNAMKASWVCTIPTLPSTSRAFSASSPRPTSSTACAMRPAIPLSSSKRWNAPPIPSTAPLLPSTPSARCASTSATIPSSSPACTPRLAVPAAVSAATSEHRRAHSRRQGELLHRQPVQSIRIRAGSAAVRAPLRQLRALHPRPHAGARGPRPAQASPASAARKLKSRQSLSDAFHRALCRGGLDLPSCCRHADHWNRHRRSEP